MHWARNIHFSSTYRHQTLQDICILKILAEGFVHISYAWFYTTYYSFILFLLADRKQIICFGIYGVIKRDIQNPLTLICQKKKSRIVSLLNLDFCFGNVSKLLYM